MRFIRLVLTGVFCASVSAPALACVDPTDPSSYTSDGELTGEACAIERSALEVAVKTRPQGGGPAPRPIPGWGGNYRPDIVTSIPVQVAETLTSDSGGIRDESGSISVRFG